MLNTEMKMLRRLAALLAVTLVAACGGGGGSSGTSSFSNAASGAADTTAANLDLLLSAATIDNSGAASITATATATTAVGQALSGVPVTFSVDNKAIFSVAGTATAANGQLSATVLPGSDPSNRIVTVTVTSGSLTKSASFAVTGAKLTGTVITVNPAPGSTGNRVDFRLINANSNPIVGQTITVTAGSLAPVTGVTGAAGDYTYTYTAPTTPGPLDITATAGGTSSTQTVTIASVATVPMAGCPATGACPSPVPVLSASVSANPSVIATNTPSTNNRTEIRALFVGPANTPVQNVRVRFDLAGDPASIGGKF